MSEGPVINRKAGRSLTPNKARPSEPSPAPEPTAAPAVESAAQETPSKRSKATNSLQNNLDLQAQARVWHFNGTFSLWDSIGTWKALIYVLIAWTLYENLGKEAAIAGNKIKGPALTLLYRLIIFGALVLFGIHWKNDVCKEKTISEWYWGSFRRNYPFLSKVFERGVIMAASMLSFQLYKQCWVKPKALGEFVFDWKDAKIMVIVSAFYITPVLTVFYKWLNEKWTLGGKWGSALFAQLVFSPVFMIFLLIFIDWVTALVADGEKSLWTIPLTGEKGDDKSIWNIINSKFDFLNTYPTKKDNYGIYNSVYPYLSKQALSFVFWFTQTVFANLYVPPEYKLAFGAVSNFAWNIVFQVFFILSK